MGNYKKLKNPPIKECVIGIGIKNYFNHDLKEEPIYNEIQKIYPKISETTKNDIKIKGKDIETQVVLNGYRFSSESNKEHVFIEKNSQFQHIDFIGVTYGPGLIGSLLVGVECAKTISLVTGKPLVPVHHIAGHIYANNLNKRLEFPLIALVVSGGHTDLVYMNKDYSFKRIGSTLDDAVGEAYDKVAKILGLDYPGGPVVDKLAHDGNDTYDLPYPLDDKSYNFSFSGIKSAVVNLVHNEKQRGNEIRVNDVCASFQKRVVSVIVKKTKHAIEEYGVHNLVIAGGVAANKALRNSLSEMAKKKGINFGMPEFKFCTDNAAMIGAAAYYAYKNGIVSDLTLNAKAIDSLYERDD